MRTGFILRLVPVGVGGHVLRLSLLLSPAAAEHLLEELELCIGQTREEGEDECCEAHGVSCVVYSPAPVPSRRGVVVHIAAESAFDPSRWGSARRRLCNI